MLRAAFIMAALDAGVPLRDVQIAARHADQRTTTVYDRRRQKCSGGSRCRHFPNLVSMSTRSPPSERQHHGKFAMLPWSG